MTATAHADSVHVGSTVTYTEPSTGDHRTVQVVVSYDADPTRGLLSAASPIGRALLGHQPGEFVRFMVPRGQRRLHIDSVL